MSSLRQRGFYLAISLLACGLVGVIAWKPISTVLANRAAAVAASRSEIGPGIYRAMGLFGDQALPAMVRNATSRDPSTAAPARRALGAWHDVWLSRSTNDRGQEMARKVQRTLSLIEAAVPELTQSGGDWATFYVSRALEAASKAKPADRSQLISAADHLLAEINRTRLLPDPPKLTDPPKLAEASPEESLATLPSLVESNRVETADDLSVSVSEARIVRALPTEPFRREPAQPRELDSPKARPLRTSDLAWQPVQQSEVNNSPETEPSFKPVELPESTTPLNYSRLSDRELLAELVEHVSSFQASRRLQAQGPGKRISAEEDPTPEEQQLMESLAQALAERGYRGISIDHAMALISNDSDERLRLVERLLTDRSGDAARLLLLLARDEMPEVRLAAISALGSSSHPQLIEAAWSLALKDKDPRIGRLADSFRRRLQ